MLQKTLENLKKINEILLTVGELGLGIYLAKHLYELDKKEVEKGREESLEEQYREALRAVRERLRLSAGAEGGSEQEEHLFT